MYLVGDIGGTKTNLVILEEASCEYKPIYENTFPSADHDSLRSIVKKVMDENDFTVEGACFGVAGPVKDKRCEATNLPWIIDASKLANVLNVNVDDVHLLNDLEAAAYGIECLQEKDFFILNKGIVQEGGTRCLVSAGTGLGESILVSTDNGYKPIPTEGGHTDFAPNSKIEIELLEFIMKKYGRVSYERILCGPGLQNVYEFFNSKTNQDISAWLQDRIKNEDPAAVISEVGMSKKDEACEKATDLFVSVYGAEAGNLALKSLATGGVYIGGGIAPKILDKMKGGGFMKSFTNKGRLSVMVSQMPVKVILNDKHPLLGCANYIGKQHKNKQLAAS